ncbi:hypothetical protein H310_13004 [Aphanomyces invadans]|uniref:C2 domain-containing protein n=1 Tax=Aphanomyces invadans TaxID=157072 RepID=A0A024TFI7_9STRA|nr:hypothetical protein H310_13004 [Aphanomyces invadans]ETV92779.1 hypothetical protein H310_13004 [Aphanomyces invadans]|eukprot:XP_008878549.1 hypothetical protein H310_13004 [Aphanomyces invadans]
MASFRSHSAAAASFGASGNYLSRSGTSFTRHILRVQLHKATDLAAGDFSLLGRHSSDPYVVLTVGKEKHKSVVIPKTLAPVWSDDSVFDFHVTDGDLFTKVLDVQVFDEDSRNDDLLATLALPLAQFATQPPTSAARPKSYTMQVPAAFAKQKVSTQIVLSIHLMDDGDVVDNPRLYIPRHFKVTLHKATDLPAADFALFGKGKSDPYVVFTIGSQRFKSDTISKNLNPVWSTTPVYEFDLTQDDLFTQVLDIQVFDSDHGMSADDLIGTLSIPLAQFDVVDAATPAPRMRPYLLNVPDEYLKQNVHPQLYLTLDMDPAPFVDSAGDSETHNTMPPDLAKAMEAMQAEIAALKLSSQGMVKKMEEEIAVSPAADSPASQPEPETEGDVKKRALVNELHGLLKLPPIKTFTKLQVSSTADGAALQWQNEIEHLKTQLAQQKRLNEMLAAQDTSANADKEEVERLKREVELHKATLAAAQSMMEEQLLREAETQKELKILKSISAVRTSSSSTFGAVTAPPPAPMSPRSKSTSDVHKADDDEGEDESLWL